MVDLPWTYQFARLWHLTLFVYRRNPK